MYERSLDQIKIVYERSQTQMACDIDELETMARNQRSNLSKLSIKKKDIALQVENEYEMTNKYAQKQ